MKKLQIRDGDTMKIAIQQEVGRSEECRYDRRLHGVLLVANGQNCRSVAELFGEDATAVQGWVRRFEARSFEGLRDGERSGRPKSVGQRQWRQLQRDVRRDPEQLGHPQGLWDGRLLSVHLTQRYGVELGVHQCQRIFHPMGFRLRKPRPLVAQADPIRVAAVKTFAV